ncbi:MAG TPA: CoA transferase [Deltaproteobacteria bacterium]|nr:CoA transferase [Deltaproteobacteria bacterium]
MKKVLEGVRVLDLTQYLSGPQATLLLAGLGAEVIRIDNPAARDPVAESPPFVGPEGVSMQRRTDKDIGIFYLKRARNKKAITLNLKSRKGKDLFCRLSEDADVLVENFSVGVTERLGIDYSSLSRRNRSLIYCSVTGYGSTGPDAGLKGYDSVAQAASGLMNLTGFPDGPPMKAGSALADSVGGVFGFGGIMAALYHRERSGEGQHVDISMVDCLFSLVFDEPLDCYEQLGLPPRMGNRIMRLSPFNSYPTEDGWIVIATGTTAQWHTVLRAIERKDLIDDARYKEMSDRLIHNDEVDALITEWTKARKTAEAVDYLREAGVICGPVRTIEDIKASRHMQARGMLPTLQHPLIGDIPGLHAHGFPIHFSKTPGGYDRPAPLSGQHNKEIYCGLLGLSPDELVDLKNEGVI